MPIILSSSVNVAVVILKPELCLTFSTYSDLIMFNVSIQTPNRKQQKHQLTNNHTFKKIEQVATLSCHFPEEYRTTIFKLVIFTVTMSCQLKNRNFF